MTTRPRLVLHVDDDPQICGMVRARLAREGFDVLSLTDPRQALTDLEESGARVVLLDIDMPHVDGLTLLRKIKVHDGGIQVIMLTAVVAMTSVLESLRYGAEACFFKPIVDVLPLAEALHDAFRKNARWWHSLDELSALKRQGQESVEV